MINTNFIKDKIEYEEYFNSYPELNNLQGDNRFIKFLLVNNNMTSYIIYIGNLNNYYFFLPIESTDISTFIIFNKLIKFNNKDINYASFNDIFIFSNILVFTKNLNSNNIKETNSKLSKEEKTEFIYTLNGIDNFNFNSIIENHEQINQFYF